MARIDNINTLFAPLDLKVDEVIKGAQSIKYKLNLPLDLKAQGKIKRAESTIKYALPSALNTNEFSFWRDKNAIYIECKSDEFQVVKFEEYITRLPKDGYYLLLGADTDGKPTFTNLRKAPHILVAGTTGSGKSELLHTFIASLIYRRKANPCEIVIIDPKRAEFSMYKNKNGVYLITEVDDAIDRLKELCEIMEDRYRMIEHKGVKDIKDLNDPSTLPIVVVIDELKDLLDQSKQAEKYIVRLAQKARACGIHLILGTQTPRADVVTGGIKANVPTRIALATTNSIESRIILERNGAEHLFGNGDMLVLGNGKLELVRVQGAYINNNLKKDLADCIPYEEHKPTPKEKPAEDIYQHYMDKGIDLKESEEWLDNQPKPEPKESEKKAKRKHVSFFNVFKLRPIMFQSEDYPHNI